MPKIPTNISVTDYIINRTGSLDTMIEQMSTLGFSGITQDISGIEVDSFYDNSNAYSNALRLDAKRLISLKPTIDDVVFSGAAFTEGFDLGYES